MLPVSARLIIRMSATRTGLPESTVIKAESRDLSSVPDGKFTHSIALFEVFQFPHTPQNFRGIYRTLQTNGVGVFLAWKRNGWYPVIHHAQNLVRADLPLHISSALDFSAEGVLLEFVVEAGFSEGNVEAIIERTVRKGEHIDEMKKSLLWNGIWDSMTVGWTDEEKGRWPAAVEEAIQKEVE